MPIRGRVPSEALGRPAPISLGTGITRVVATSPLVLALVGSEIHGSVDTTRVVSGGGTYALEGTLDAAIRDTTRGVEIVVGSQASPETSPGAALLVEKYLGADVTDNAGHAQVVISKKVAGSGAANARSGGINIEAIDKVGWAGSGVQAFCEGLHSKSIAGWSGAGRKGSVQAAVLDTVADSADGPSDFGFVNTLEVTTRNKVKDPGARSWATLNGAWPSDFMLTQLLFNYSDSTHPADAALCIGNGYGEGKFYNGLIIRSGAIQSGGYLIRTPYLTVADTGRVTVGPAAGGGDAGYPLGVVAETSSTNDLGVVESLIRRSTGAVAAGFGLGKRIELEDAGGSTVQVFQDNYEWIDPAAGTRTAKWSAFVIDAGGARTLWVAASDGTQGLLGFHGVDAVARQAIGATLASRTAGATYGATEQTMLQEAHDRARTITAALIACGLMKA